MHRIEPARLKPGASLDQIPSGDVTTDAPASDDGRSIRGRALILWDHRAV